MKYLIAFFLFTLSSVVSAGIPSPWSDATLKAAMNIPNTNTDDQQPLAAYLDCFKDVPAGHADAYPYTTNMLDTLSTGYDNFYILLRASTTVYPDVGMGRYTRPTVTVVARKTLWFSYDYGGQNYTIGLAPGQYNSTSNGYKWQYPQIDLGLTPMSTSRPDFKFASRIGYMNNPFNNQAFIPVPFLAWFNVTIGGANKRFYMTCYPSEWL